MYTPKVYSKKVYILIAAPVVLAFLMNVFFLVFLKKPDPDPNPSKASEPIQHAVKIPIDLAMCKAKYDGYVYFKIGLETFRYNGSGPIVIAVWAREGAPIKNMESKGCRDNPYTTHDVSVGVDSDYFREFGGEETFDNFNYFGIIEVNPIHYNEVNFLQETTEKRYYDIKREYSDCIDISTSLGACFFRPKGSNAENWATVYLEKKAGPFSVLKRPFSMECSIYVGTRLCEAEYRIYKSVNLVYKYYPKKVAKDKILPLHEFLVLTLNKMRVMP